MTTFSNICRFEDFIVSSFQCYIPNSTVEEAQQIGFSIRVLDTTLITQIIMYTIGFTGY